jgi:hypothetical protein
MKEEKVLKIKIRTGIIHSINHQRAKIALSTLCLLFIFSSCYTVNEHTYLSIVFNESKLNAVYLNKYVDSVRNHEMIIPDSIKELFFNGRKMYDNERLIHFENTPQEWYLINFDATPCWIEAIYNPLLSNGMIYDKRFISAGELNRVKKRFETEVLRKADEYGKNHGLADSTLYNSNKRK